MNLAQRVMARYKGAAATAPIIVKFVERAYKKHKAKIDERIKDGLDEYTLERLLKGTGQV